MRSRLQQVLDTLRIDLEGQTIDQALSAEGRVLGAVSLIQCGLSLMKNGKLETSGTIMPKAANNPFTSQVMSTCVARHLDPLPASVQTVVLLDTADTYVKGVKDLMRGRFSDYRDINDVASPLKVESGCLRHIRARQMASLVIGEAGTGRERSISGSGAAARQVVATKFLTTIVEASHRAIARVALKCAAAYHIAYSGGVILVRSFCIVSSGAKQFGVSVLAPDRILRLSRSRK
jgi:hypothetical protein